MEDKLKKAQKQAIDVFEKHKLVFQEANGVQLMNRELFLKQLNDWINEYCSQHKSYNFWEHIVIQIYQRYKKQQMVSKVCYQFLYSWIKHSVSLKELRVTLVLTEHEECVQLMRFYLKFKKTIESYQNKAVRSEIFKLDEQFIPMDVCLITIKKLFKTEQYDAIKQKYLQFLNNLEKQQQVTRDQVSSVDFLLFSLQQLELESMQEKKIKKEEANMIKEEVNVLSEQKEKRSVSARPQKKNENQYGSLKSRLNELESYNNHITIEVSNLQKKYEQLLQLCGNIIDEIKANPELSSLLDTNQTLTAYINQFQLFQPNDTFIQSIPQPVDESVLSNQFQQSNNKENHLEKIKLNSEIYAKPGTKNFYYIHNSDQKQGQSNNKTTPRKKIFDPTTSAAVTSQHQQIIHNIEELKTTFRKRLVQQISQMNDEI